jgi:hypothetical protein
LAGRGGFGLFWSAFLGGSGSFLRVFREGTVII